jgi:hypothetical protein
MISLMVRHPLRKILTPSAAPTPLFEGGVRKCRSGSTLSKLRPPGRGVEGLTFRLLVSLLILATFPLAAIGADVDYEILPYVQNVSNTSATVMWKSVGEVTGQVEYGVTIAYGASAEGQNVYVMKGKLAQPKKGSVVRAQLTGLLPDTVYHYRVALPSSVSEDRIFRTGPAAADAAITFVVYGDSRTQPEVHARVASAAAATCDPAFVLTTGDAVPSSSARQSVWRKQFFEPADPLLRETWFLITQGNHDNRNQLLSLYFEAPGGGQVEDYYSFDWGPVHVTTINTNKDYRPGSEQYRFLEWDFANTARPFKVFFGHHPAYSSGYHGSNKKMQKYLQPLFEANGVKLVFAGHDHSYERTVINGITYIVSGGGGAPLHEQRTLSKNPGSLVFVKANNFVQVDVAIDSLFVTAWAVNEAGEAKMVDQTIIVP